MPVRILTSVTSVAALNQGLSVDVFNEDMMLVTLPPKDRPIIANPKTKRLYPASQLSVSQLIFLHYI